MRHPLFHIHYTNDAEYRQIDLERLVMYVKAVWKHLDKVGVCCARSMYNVKSSWQWWQNKLSFNIRSLSCPCSKDSDKEGWTWNVSIKLRNWCVLAWNDENQKFTNAHVCQYGKRRKMERVCFSKPEQTKPAKQSSEARQGAELSGRGGTWSMERRRIMTMVMMMWKSSWWWLFYR